MSAAQDAATVEQPAAGGAVYVYGVVRAGTLRSIDAEGIRAAPVAVVEKDGVAALVSRLPEGDLRVTRKELRRHLDVIAEAFRRTTILPCPFGTSVESTDAVVETVLGPQRGKLLAGLEQLDGAAQMNLKVRHDQDALLREIVASDPVIARLRQETDALGDAGYYKRLTLGERVAAAVAARRVADAARVLEALEREALETIVDEADGSLVLKASFLVAQARLDRFDSALEDVAEAEQGRLWFEAIGPLPPTSFASAAVEP